MNDAFRDACRQISRETLRRLGGPKPSDLTAAQSLYAMAHTLALIEVQLDRIAAACERRNPLAADGDAESPCET